MLKNKWPIVIMVLGTILMVINDATKPVPLDVRPTLTKADKIPYGNFLLFELLTDIFPEKEIEVTHKSFFDFYVADSLQQKNYVSINYPTQSGKLFTNYDVEHLLSYVANGNNVFISNQTFSNKLQDTLSFEIENSKFKDINLNGIALESADSQKVVSVKTNENYLFKSTFIYRYFSAFDTTNTTILAYKTDSQNFSKQAILIKTKFGDGNFILNTTPLIFSNYNMVSNQHNFIAEALSNLPIKNTVWDEYYKPYALAEAKTTPLRYLLSQKPLKWALYLTLIVLLIYTFFSGKRLQRVIPILQAPKNVNVDFANSLAMLYFHKKDHTEIAKKRIEYFAAFIRNKYNISIADATATEVAKLKNLTKLNIKEIELLFNRIKEVINKSSISETELIQLNQKIDEFYKNT